jgi:hypothetical protein
MRAPDASLRADERPSLAGNRLCPAAASAAAGLDVVLYAEPITDSEGGARSSLHLAYADGGSGRPGPASIAATAARAREIAVNGRARYGRAWA